MEPVDEFYVKEKYLQTSSGNKICRESVLCGTNQIVLLGESVIMDGVTIRGDLCNVRIGRNCIIRRGAVVRPAFKKYSRGVAFFPLEIGNNVIIDEDVVTSAAYIGNCVHIGRRSVIGRRCLLKEYSAVLADSVLAPETLVPSYAVFGGNPAKQVDTLPECMGDMMVSYTKDWYRYHFKPTSAR